MITEQIWKHKPSKLTVVQVHVADLDQLKLWLGAVSVSVVYPNEGPRRLDFEVVPGGRVVVYEGEYLSKDSEGVVTRWTDEAALKQEYKRA